MALTHYVVVRRDLTFGEYSAQLAHAGEVYSMLGHCGSCEHTDERGAPVDFVLNETIAIVKGIRNEQRLLKLEAALVAAGVPHVAIREETGPGGGRIAGQLTCVSLMPVEDRASVAKYLEGIHTIQGLDPVETR